MRRAFRGLLTFFSLFLFLGGCKTVGLVIADGKMLYLKNNIHAQEGRRDCKASYANWTNPGIGHFIVPVNTGIRIGHWRRGFYFVNETDRKKVFFEFDSIRMKMDVKEYLALITSPEPEPVSLEAFSDIDRKGINDGKAYVGMTKEGIRTALGFPAVHATPSLDDNTWTYWTNRFRTKVIEFDENGKVKEIR